MVVNQRNTHVAKNSSGSESLVNFLRSGSPKNPNRGVALVAVFVVRKALGAKALELANSKHSKSEKRELTDFMMNQRHCRL